MRMKIQRPLVERIDRLFLSTVELGSSRIQNDGEDSFGYALTTFGAVITNSIAIGVAAYGKETLEIVSVQSIPFAMVATAVLGTQVGILRASRDGKNRLFSRGSIMFTRWIFSWTLVFALAIPMLASGGGLPGQLTAANVGRYDFKYPNDTQGISLSYEIPPGMIEEHLSNGQLTLYVLLDSRVTSRFQIVPKYFHDSKELKGSIYVPGYDYNDRAQETPRAFVIDLDVKQVLPGYRLELRLLPMTGRSVDLEDEVQRLKTQDLIRIIP